MPQQPEVFAALVHHLMAFGCSLGLDDDTLTQASGLTEAQREDPDARVPFEALLGLWRLYTTRFPSAPLGLTMAQTLDTRKMGLLGQLVANSLHVRTAVERLVRFSRILDPLLDLHIEGSGDRSWVRIEHELCRTPAQEAPEVCEPMEMLTMTMCYFVYNHAIHPTLHRDNALLSVEMAHPRRHPAAIYEARFFSPVHFGCPCYRIVFRSAVLDATFPDADPDAGRYIERYASTLMDRLDPRKNQTTTIRVRTHLYETLEGGVPPQDDVAKALGMSIRTLQRRLRSEGVSYSSLLDDVRRNRALDLLEDPQLAVYEIAHRLGYQDATSFYRAFRRWSQLTPEQLRHRSDEGSSSQ